MFKMNKKGFTLVELLVVLAILGLLAGIGIPQYMNTLKRSRQAADAALVATVQSAVDGYMAETGLKATETTHGTPAGTDPTPYKKLQGADDKLNFDANGASMLTNAQIFFNTFLENGAAPTSFKSVTSVSVQWYISDSGKVHVTGTAPDGSTITIPAP